MIIDHIRNFFAGRWYALYVSGHGSSFKREGRLMTKKEAFYQADRWVGDACTIGGSSQIQNVVTGKIVPYQEWAGYSLRKKVS